MGVAAHAGADRGRGLPPLAEQALERKISEVVAPDAWWLKGGLSADVLSDALVGRHFLAARRTGKRMMLDTSDHGPVLGLKFGMTGRLLVDGLVGIEKLEYSSNREVEAWDRLVVVFADGGDLRVRDPRRLGGAELDPEEGRLGPDAVGLTLAGLRARARDGPDRPQGPAHGPVEGRRASGTSSSTRRCSRPGSTPPARPAASTRPS